jgi:uncharacterized damage-inducible protein DinB
MILRQQYALTLGARKILLDFIEAEVGEDLNAPLATHDNKSICDVLVHSANCYVDWLAYFALQRTQGSLKTEKIVAMSQIRARYLQVDEIVTTFCGQFAGNLDLAITGTPDGWPPPMSATPLEVFTHVLTHEFHHKGQIANMCRQLGHIPPDTDIYRIFPVVTVD